VTAASLRDGTCFEYRFDAGHAGAFWLARQLMEQWLRERHVRTEVIGDLLVVTTELATGATDGVVLRAEAHGEDVEIAVESSSGDAVLGETGDLRLAAALCDEVTLKVTPERTVVHARRHCAILPE
jgi:hypothetical protein